MSKLQREIEDVFPDVGAIAVNLEEPEGGGWFVHIAEHLAEESCMLLSADPQASLCDEVAERLWCRELSLCSHQMCVDLFSKHIEARMVADQMMFLQQQEPAIACCVVGNKDTQQRSVVQVDPFFGMVDLMQEVLGDIGGVRIEYYLHDGKSSFAEDDLNRLRQSFPEESATQNVMPIDDSLHCRHATIQKLPVAEGQYP
jgi:hypothetical protein